MDAQSNLFYSTVFSSPLRPNPPRSVEFSPFILIAFLASVFYCSPSSLPPSFLLPLALLHLLSFIRKGTSTPKDKNSSVRFRNQQGLRSCKVHETERQYSYLVTGDRIKQYEASVLASYAVYEMSDKKQVRTCRQTLHLYGRMDPVSVLLRATGCMTNDPMMLFYDSAFTSYVLTLLCCAVVLLCCVVWFDLLCCDVVRCVDLC